MNCGDIANWCKKARILLFFVVDIAVLSAALMAWFDNVGGSVFCIVTMTSAMAAVYHETDFRCSKSLESV